ncbi:hypothetical protein FQN55_005238 [Onygenales sp. PD_40]|nr:hypothetical protein FQN55_005238 [Onygenales sp. PD_40]
MSMKTATYGEDNLTHYVDLEVGVEGLPWLYSVDSRIGVKESSLIIGDARQGETQVEIKGPAMEFEQGNNILLFPPQGKMSEKDMAEALYAAKVNATAVSRMDEKGFLVRVETKEAADACIGKTLEVQQNEDEDR